MSREEPNPFQPPQKSSSGSEGEHDEVVMAELLVPEKEKKPFTKQAAQASAVAPFVAIVLNSATRSVLAELPSARAIISATWSLLIVAGFIGAVIGLLGIRKHGVKGILIPALLGLLINGFLIGSAVALFISLSNRDFNLPNSPR